MTGLFGNPSGATAQPAAGGTSLFGGLNFQKPAQQTSSNLFGSNTQTQQPATSLFGNTANNQTQQQSAPSLFGATTTQPQQTQQQQQQQPATSLFGTTTNNNTQQAGGLTTNQNTNPNAQQPQQTNSQQQSGAYFDTLLQKSRKRANGDSTLDELPSLELGLGDLRDRIKRFAPSSTDRGTTDGRAHYILAASGVQPGVAERDLSFFDTQAKKAAATTPTIPADTDVESYIANLRTRTTLSMIDEGLKRSVRDFDMFLEENTSIEWEAQRKRIYQHFGIKARTDESFGQTGASQSRSGGGETGGFGRSRRSRIGAALSGRNTMGATVGSTRDRSTMLKSVIGSVGPVGSVQRSPFANSDSKSQALQPASVGGGLGRSVRMKETKFIEKVQGLNSARIHKEAYPLLHQFADVERNDPGEQSEFVIRAYNALIEIVGEQKDIRSNAEPNVPKERQFAKAWVEDAQNSLTATEIRKRILAGAGRYLEKECFREMESLLAKNPREAALGGVPNVLSKVKAYVRLCAARKDLPADITSLQMMDGEYIWAIVYYLLRTGHVSEAVEYVQSCAIPFRTIDRYFFQYLSAYNSSKDRRLPQDLQNRINNEYTQRLRNSPENSVDAFRMACYKVIGRCDLQDISFTNIRKNVFDWAWLNVSLAREVNVVDEYAGAVFTLASAQKNLRELTEKYGDNKDYRGLLFFFQILFGLFEDAVSFLSGGDNSDALHFAIGLDYYGLLRVSSPEPSDSLLTLSATGRPQVNFAFMVGYYTANFRAANVVAAVDYITLMCLNGDLAGEAGLRHIQICHEALRQLVLESREFTKLLGDMQLDGKRTKGAIEERMSLLRLADTDDFMRAVTLQAAAIADDIGRVTDAVLLYDLAGEYDNVVTITNRALSDAVALEIGQEQISLQAARSRQDQVAGGQQNVMSLTSVEDPVKLAQTITHIYNSNARFYDKVSTLNRDTVRVLLSMNEAKKRVEAQNWTGALDIIASLDILPLEAHGDSNTIRQFANKYSSLPETITRNVPNLIMWTGTSCEQQRLKLSNSQYNSNEGTRRQMMEDLKRKAKDLTMYSGFLKYRLPPWVNDMLARIAAE